MAETDAVFLHHPIYRAAAHPAAEAVTQVLGGGHDQAGGVVFVEGAAAA
jgi:hypothetical protein